MGHPRNGKRRYRCLNLDCPGHRREVKQQIIEMTLNGSGVRDIARVLYMSAATVIE